MPAWGKDDRLEFLQFRTFWLISPPVQIVAVVLSYVLMPHLYRVIYEINTKEHVVTVFQVRHGARSDFVPVTLYI